MASTNHFLRGGAHGAQPSQVRSVSTWQASNVAGTSLQFSPSIQWLGGGGTAAGGGGRPDARAVIG
eukprot:964584-Prymnesium_polylepis.1